MANLNGFNANEVDPAVGYDAIPAGKYLAIITESEMKPTKNGAGKYLQLTFQVLEGQYQGRLVWARLNLENSSQQAVRMARAELSAICRAVGVMAPRDSLELHDLPLVIKVDCKRRNDTGEMGNVIKGYERKGAAAVSSPPVAAGDGSKPPWAK